MNKIQRERRAANRWRLIKNMGFLFAAGAAVVSGARTTQAVWPAPPIMVLVCLEDVGGPRNCIEYRSLEEYQNND